MPTFTALTTLEGEDCAQSLGLALENLVPEPYGVGVFEVEDGSGIWEVGGYFLEAPDAMSLAVLEAAFGARPFAVSELPETDWVAEVRRELSPVAAGRFFLFGSHDADKVPDGVIPLTIDAAMAFGTGHHGTTKGCLEALDALANDGFVGKNVVDIGCGTAALAMAAAKIWPGVVLASDIDQVAVDTAIANIGFNDLEGRVECVTCPGFDHSVLRNAAPFDLIFANILKSPLIGLAPDMGDYAQDNAFAILSGILNEQVVDVLAAYKANGFVEHARIVIGDWSTLTLQKHGA